MTTTSITTADKRNPVYTKWDVQNPLNHLNDHDLSDQVVKIAVKMACGVHGAFGLETQWAENGHADVFSMDFGLDAYNIYIYIQICICMVTWL